MGSGGAERPDESEAYKALAEQTATYFNRYREVFVPLENQYINSVFDAGEGAAYEKAMGSAAMAAQAQYEPKIGQAQQALLARGGVDPSSGAFRENTGDMYSKLGVARGLNAADAGINNTDRFAGGLQNLVKMGQGIASEAMQGQIGLAQVGEDKARSIAATDFAKDQRELNTLGTAAGVGAGGVYNYFGGNGG